MGAIKKILYCIFISWLTTSVSLGQDQALQNLIQGKKYFWEAKFEESMASLKAVLDISTTNKDYLFEAHLYMGFVLARQNANKKKINAAFEQAIKIDPKRRLDELVIPPDLSEMFNKVRNQLVGCIYVNTDPLGAEVMGVQGDSILFIETTPILLCELTTKEYQILIAKNGFEEHLMPFHVTSGGMDTLFVTLNPIIGKKSGGTKLWTWVARGGIVASAAAAALLFKTVLVKDKNEIEDLPSPPERPTP
ncbi:MAG: hypothetical protein ACE5JB_07680 [bacterium]